VKVGTVKWYNDDKGFGFIIGEKCDVFMHYTQIHERQRNLMPGQQVRFVENEGPRGLFATDVELV